MRGGKFLRSPVYMATALGLVVLLLSTLGVTRPSERRIGGDDEQLAAGSDGVDALEPGIDPSLAGPGAEPGAGGGGAAQARQGAAGATQGAARARAFECAPGRNGGATDAGVTATKVKLASTAVLSGVGASFLGDSPKGMQAVIQKVNRQGGICGRTLELTVRDDAWNANTGLTFLKNFMKADYFALPVVPSSEGLTAAIEAGEISKAGIPVVGSDGMLRQQYADPWVWPVATATISTMRVMAKHGYDSGARTFGIVYDNEYRFGKEGNDAFAEYVRKLPGASLKIQQGVQPAQSSYASEVKKFNDACNPCDMVAYLLEPGTAETWMAGRPAKGRVLTSGAQTLFNRRFALNCRSACQDVLVWTGYTPPIDSFASLPGVATYVNDVRAVDPSIDVDNAFLQGSYLGMTVFVEALKKVGPDLTRARLREVMNTQPFTHDLAGNLSWKERRFANTSAQAFSLQYAGETFSGFRNEQTGRLPDPSL